jgi:hypothetical protein
MKQIEPRRTYNEVETVLSQNWLLRDLCASCSRRSKMYQRKVAECGFIRRPTYNSSVLVAALRGIASGDGDHDELKGKGLSKIS